MIANPYNICCMNSVSFKVNLFSKTLYVPQHLDSCKPEVGQYSLSPAEPSPISPTALPEGTQHVLKDSLVLVRPLPENHYMEIGLPQRSAVPQVNNWTLHLRFFLCGWGTCLPIVHSVMGGLLIVLS